MARYSYDLVLNQPEDFVQFIMNDFLQKNQFTMTDYNGESVYRAGDAVVEGYKYLKWSYVNGVFHIEAWLKGVGGEMGLDGFVGTLQKKPYKDSLEQLYAALQQPVQTPQGQPPQSGPQGVPVYTVDNTSAATMALVFGVCSILMGWLIPIAGLILGILGVTRARLGKHSSFAGRAKAGKICSIIGLCLSVLVWVLNIILVFF